MKFLHQYLKLGTTFLLIPSLYLKMFSYIISASDNCVTYTAFVDVFNFWHPSAHLLFSKYSPLESISWCNIPVIVWILLESFKFKDQSLHTPSLFEKWPQSLKSVYFNLSFLNMQSSLTLAQIFASSCRRYSWASYCIPGS